MDILTYTQAAAQRRRFRKVMLLLHVRAPPDLGVSERSARRRSSKPKELIHV